MKFFPPEGLNKWPNVVDLSAAGIPYGKAEFMEFDYNGQRLTYDFDDAVNVESLFSKASPLSSVILRMATMFAKGKTEVVNRRTGNFVRGQNKEWDMLFLKPNPLQTRLTFLTQLMTYVLMRGWCYALKVYPEGFTDRPSSIWLLPPWCIRVEKINKKPYLLDEGDEIRKVFFSWEGVEEELDQKDLILFTDAGATLTDKQTLLPESRINNLSYPVLNMIGGLETRRHIIFNRGADGILANTANDVNGVIPVGEKEISRLTNHYKRKYGRIGNQVPVIITNAALKYYPIAMKVEDMQLHPEHKSATIDICDQYGYNFHLMSMADGAKFENAKQYMRDTYDNTIMPLSDSLFEQLNIALNTPMLNIEIIHTYDHLRVFQQNEKERGEGLNEMNDALEKMYKNNLITRNDWLFELGRDKIDENDPNSPFNKYNYQLTPEERGIIIDPNANPDDNNKNE